MISGENPAACKIGMAGVVITLVVILLCASSMQAQSPQVRTEGFRYQRAIIPGGAGPNRLEIDPALLASANPFRELSGTPDQDLLETTVVASGGLSDLRIYDAANREVPYLLIAPVLSQPRWIEARILPVAATKKTSGFEADLGRILPVDSLRLDGIPAPFMKRYQLEGSGDRNRWTVLVAEGTFFDFPAEKLKLLGVDFTPGAYRYLRVTWDDGTSARIPLPRLAASRVAAAVPLPPPPRVSLQFGPRTSEPGVSRYRIHLPGANLPLVAIELACKGGNVMRRTHVTEGRLTEYEMAPAALGSATLVRTVHGRESAELRIPIARPREAELDLRIDNGDNPPLEITGISAVFAYLPWIYFESPDNQPLTARFGNRDLTAPRYDLEAARAAIVKLHTAEAHWGAPQAEASGTVAANPMPSLSVGAALDVGAFRYARRIQAGKQGLNALLLDAAVLAHSHMSDLRIGGPDGKQIPYLIEKQDEPLDLKLPLPEKTQVPVPRRGAGRSVSGSVSRYLLRLPYANLPGAKLVLTTSARVFRREADIVLEKNPYNKRQEPWTYQVASAAWSHSDADTPSPSLILQLPTMEAAEAVLEIEEGDNSPLPLQSAILLLPSYRLRFFRAVEGDLTLYYGQSHLAAPRYDLALLGPHLIGAAAEEVALAPENAIDSRDVVTQSKQRVLFWIILGLAVLVLFGLIARLMRKAADPKAL